MLGNLGRLIAALLIGLFVFVLAAMGLASPSDVTSCPRSPTPTRSISSPSFGPLDYKSKSSAFRGGSVQTWFGGGVVDLRQATLDPMGATIEVNALFGGGNLVVPEEWNVETKIAGIGGIGDARPQRDRSPEAPTLRVEGIALFGGWGITSEPADEATDEVLAPV